MKLEKTFYVVMRVGNIEMRGIELGKYETAFASSSDLTEFTDNIEFATKFSTRSTALTCKQEYDMWKNSAHESDLKIIPIKVVYEW